jgi:hypothetical protein
MREKLIKRFLILFVLAAGVVAVGVLKTREYSPRRSEEKPSPYPSLPSLSQVNKQDLGAGGKKQDRPVPRESNLDAEILWREFQEKFGANLKPEFSPSKKLVSVQGQFGQGQFAAGSFRSEDPKKAIARAREIISSAATLMGIDPKWPLENALARGSKISAQVFFNQTHEGIIVVPFGNVKVDLGAKGELIGLYSSYSTDIQIVNQVRMDSEEAQLKVVEAFQDPNNTSLHVDGGGKVIWVHEHLGRYAYEFLAQGRQVVVDAQTGKILDMKDIRQR